jgi:signal transduction histidine kinase
MAQLDEIFRHPNSESYDVIEFVNGRVFERYSRPQQIDGKTIGRVFSYRDITARKQDEAKIHSQALRLKTLADVSRILAEAKLESKTILNITAAKIADLLGDGCIIRLLSENRAKLITHAFHDRECDYLQFMRITLFNTSIGSQEGPEGLAIQTRKTVVKAVTSSEIDETILLHEFGLSKTPFTTSSWLAAPMQVAGKLVGVITAFRRSFDPYTLDDQAFFQDLTDRAALALENSTLFAEAQQAIRTREEFMMIASHELKTPLTPLRMQLQMISHLIQKGALEGTPKSQTLIKLVHSSDQNITRLVRLIEEMMDVSQVSTRRLRLVTGEVDLVALVYEVVDRYSSDLDATKSPIEITADPHVFGKWDPFRIEQIVVNLLTNALKYGAGKPIHISILKFPEKVRLSVQDFGIGISSEDQKRIFERFERAVSIQKFEGLGLGLYITQQIVEAHGGKIRLESTLGKGSTFIVELPT